MLRIGVICEGQTDYWAIENFLGHALEERGVAYDFVDLQPPKDATQPDAGWGEIERWFERFPPQTRIKRFIGGGLFEGALDAKKCDLFLVQMDTDVLDDQGFRQHVEEKTGLAFGAPNIEDAVGRADAVTEVIHAWARLNELTQRDVDLHVTAPAVESTETWCVAVFRNHRVDLELLKGPDLGALFMESLVASEGRPQACGAVPDKNVVRRKAFCRRHRGGSERAIRQCRYFSSMVEAVVQRAAALVAARAAPAAGAEGLFE